LYNSSFDTLSENGVTFSVGSDDPLLTDATRRKECEDRTVYRDASQLFQASNVPPAPGPNESDLPELSSPDEIFVSSELSVGDISPIKLIYSEGCAPQIDRRADAHSFDFGFEKGSNVSIDWRTDETNRLFSSNQSNPFFVLRSVRKAFENFRYLLPCMHLPPDDSNKITMSDYGSIRQYKPSIVSFTVILSVTLHYVLTKVLVCVGPTFS
jgi:hypothetical protein